MARREKDDRYYEEMQEKVNRLRQMFTTTSIGVAAVAVVFILNPFSERARIIELKGFEDSIYYHVWINEGINFTEGSVALVFQTEDEIFRIPLAKGETYGILKGVQPLTGYPARIEGSEGFGISTIVSSGVFSKNEPDFEMYKPVLVNSDKDELLIYNFETYYQDLKNEIKNLRLTYGFTPLQTGQYVEQYNENIQLDQLIQIKDIPNQNVLIKTKVTGDVPVKDAEGNVSIQNVLIDEDEFYTPLYHESSYEIIRVIDSVIEYEVIPDYRYLQNVSYKITIFENGRALESRNLSRSNTDAEHLLRFERLFPSTKYQIVHEMLFFDHRSNLNSSVIIEDIEITTLERFDFITSIADQENRLLITVVVADVNSLFNKAYYEIRDGNNVITSREVDLINVDRVTKFAEFGINKLDLNNRTLIFGVIMNDEAKTKYEIRKIRR
jgi:hypothetical protein